MYYADDIFTNIAVQDNNVLEVKRIDASDIDKFDQYFPSDVIEKMKAAVYAR
jgi:hypothetical protein